MQEILTTTFAGLAYDSAQPDTANAARATHFYHHARQLLERGCATPIAYVSVDQNSPSHIEKKQAKQKKQAKFMAKDDGTILEVFEWPSVVLKPVVVPIYNENTEQEQAEEALQELFDNTALNHDRTISVNYQLPITQAWQVVIHCRLVGFIANPNQLKKFPSEYHKCVAALEAKAKGDWYRDNWSEVTEALKKLVTMALENFIRIALQEKNKEDQKHYLSLVTNKYRCCSVSWTGLLADEFKYLAASLYHDLGDLEKSKMFLLSVRDWPNLLAKSPGEPQTKRVLLMLEGAGLKENVLSQAETPEKIKCEHVEKLLAKQSFVDALAYLEKASVGKFVNKELYILYAKYGLSRRTKFMDTLAAMIGLEEQQRTAEFWQYFGMMLYECVSSLNKYAISSPGKHQSLAEFYGLIIICAEQQEGFTLEQDQKANMQDRKALAHNALRIIFRGLNASSPSAVQAIEADIDKKIQFGHAVLRGETEYTLVQVVKMALSRVSNHLVAKDGAMDNYIPIDVPADGDCLFHCFNLSRKEAIEKIKGLINLTKGWIFNRSIDSLAKQKQSAVFEILLSYIEFDKGETYPRGQEAHATNKQIILAFLDGLAKSGVYIPFIERRLGFIDALALTLDVNVKVYNANSSGELFLSSDIRLHNPDFDTISLLFTSAEGCQAYGSSLSNHYIRLQHLPLDMVEMRSDSQQRYEAVVKIKKWWRSTRLDSVELSMMNPIKLIPESEFGTPLIDYKLTKFKASSDGRFVMASYKTTYGSWFGMGNNSEHQTLVTYDLRKNKVVSQAHYKLNQLLDFDPNTRSVAVSDSRNTIGLYNLPYASYHNREDSLDQPGPYHPVYERHTLCVRMPAIENFRLPGIRKAAYSDKGNYVAAFDNTRIYVFKTNRTDEGYIRSHKQINSFSSEEHVHLGLKFSADEQRMMIIEREQGGVLSFNLYQLIEGKFQYDKQITFNDTERVINEQNIIDRVDFVPDTSAISLFNGTSTFICHHDRTRQVVNPNGGANKVIMLSAHKSCSLGRSGLTIFDDSSRQRRTFIKPTVKANGLIANDKTLVVANKQGQFQKITFTI